MALPWTPAQRIAAYRAEGITKIVEMPNWQNHERDDETGKIFGPVYGLLVHHTAGVSSTMANFVRNGSSALPGPLAHDFLAKDGTLYVVSHGRANHAGTTTKAVKDAFIADRAPAGERSIGAETEDANDFLWGIEIENWGDGIDPYPPVQYDVAVRWAAAHCRHYGWGANSAWGHKEITTRKIDPTFPMGNFRTAVARRLAPSPEPDLNGAPPVDAFTSLAKLSTKLIGPGETYVVYWDAEYQDGPGDHGTGGKTVVSGEHVTGTVAVQFADPVPAGVTVRAVHELDNGTRSNDYSIPLVAGTAGGVLPYTGRVAEDRNLVFEIENDSAASVELIWAGARFGSWAL